MKGLNVRLAWEFWLRWNALEICSGIGWKYSYRIGNRVRFLGGNEICRSRYLFRSHLHFLGNQVHISNNSCQIDYWNKQLSADSFFVVVWKSLNSVSDLNYVLIDYSKVYIVRSLVLPIIFTLETVLIKALTKIISSKIWKVWVTVSVILELPLFLLNIQWLYVQFIWKRNIVLRMMLCIV